MRDLYEVPAAEILLTAHQELEKLVCTIHQNEFKHILDRKWAYPRLRRAVGRAAARTTSTPTWTSVNEQVTGEITMRLYKGRADAVARKSPNALYDQELAGFGESGGLFSQQREPRLHRAVVAADADGLRDPKPGQGGVMSKNAYAFLGWAVVKIAQRVAKRKAHQNRGKMAAAARGAAGRGRGHRRGRGRQTTSGHDSPSPQRAGKARARPRKRRVP